MDAPMIKKYFIYDYSDVHRGLLGTLSAITALLICMHGHFNLSAIMWLMLASSLTCLAISGTTKLQQIKNISIIAIILAACIPLTSLLLQHAPFLVFWIFMILLFWGILTLPRLLPSFSVGSIITLVFLVMLIAKPKQTLSGQQLLLYQSLPILSGIVILSLWTLILPLAAKPITEVDQSSYYIKRAFRLSIAVPIAFSLAALLHLQHASWVCFSVVVVSQANFGATIRRSLHRLIGTLMGVIIGVPIAIYIFGAYPWTHWLTLVIFFSCLVSAVRFYYIAIFLATLLIAALYYVISPGHIGPTLYIIYRLIDTSIGIILAITLEAFVFPNSLEHQVRKLHRQFWADLYYYIFQSSKCQGTETDQIIASLDNNLNAMNLLMNDMQYEPIGKFTLRFRRSDALFKQYHKLTSQFTAKSLWKNSTKVNNQDIKNLLSVLNKLKNLPYLEHAVLAKILADICYEQNQFYNTINSNSSNIHFINANHCLLETIHQLTDIANTPRWAFK
jgi:hypothetical protein